MRTGRLSTPFETYLATALDDPMLDYEAVFRPWREVFGDRLAVYPLETAARMSGGLLAHFLALLGADGLTPAAAALPRMNERIGAKHLEVLRLTRLALEGLGLDEKAIRERLLPVLSKLPPFLDGDAPFVGLDLAQARAVTEHFAASNARFAREYGIDGGGVLFQETAWDTEIRPNRAEWQDFSAMERGRIRRFVREAVGVDLPPGAAVAGTSRDGQRVDGVSTAAHTAEPDQPRGMSPPARRTELVRAIAGRIRSGIRWRVRTVMNHGRRVGKPVGIGLDAMAQVRRPSDLRAFLRWLRWEIEWWCRRKIRRRGESAVTRPGRHPR